MKKILLFLVAAVLAVTAACAGAEETGILDQLKGQVFTFSSGVGGWSNELTFGKDGSFTGNYHDSEMGETGEGYPDGSLYGCLYHGQLTDPEKVDEYTWTAGITVEPDEGQAPEAIEDGIRYVTSEPYGVSKAKTVTIYLPGKPVEQLPEGFLPWSHLQEIDPEAKVLPYYAIWSEADEAGFIADQMVALAQAEPAAEGTKINCEIVEGSYVIQIDVADGDTGWTADDMSQDDTVVKLYDADVIEDTFVARYDPVGDGDVTVGVRHFTGIACDEVHTFDLHVENGAVTESTGGSYTASPDEAEMDPFLSGEWTESGTHFTQMTISKNAERGWDVEIASPLTHGAYVFKATIYYDCELDSFVYDKGMFWDVPVTEEPNPELGEAKITGTSGSIAMAGDEKGITLTWTDPDERHDAINVVFEPATAAK